MKIIRLNQEDIPYALALANQVFDHSVKPGTMPGVERVIGYYRDYARENVLREQMISGSLYMWGVKDGGYLVAVSAMSCKGHITMLYVHPQYMRRRCGRKLLHAMKVFAADELGLHHVTVNVMPVWSAGFFAKEGFKNLPAYQGGQPVYVPMSAPSLHEVRYRVKHVPLKAILWICIGCPVLIALITIAYTLYYLNV